MTKHENKSEVLINMYNKDKSYWDNFYKDLDTERKPSDFAKSIVKYLKQNDTVVDLGCGNGRDSCYFIDNGMSVVGIDESEVAISLLNDEFRYNNIAEFMCGDFCTNELIFSRVYDAFYSRFTLHSVNYEQQLLLFDNVYKCLKNEGYFFIEVRSVNDDIFGKGECIGRNEYVYDDHYRRFLVIEELLEELKKKDFNILYAEESKGFSKILSSDPMLIRVVACK